MKIATASLLAFVTIFLYLGKDFVIDPTDIQAAFAWNLSLILTPAFALFFQWKMARERQIPTALLFTVVAVINTALVLGSRVGAWSIEDWRRIWSGSGLPEHPGKTILGGLVLAIILFVWLRRWWRLPSSLADTVFIGLPVAGVLARVGCLFAGCCYGIPSGGGGICYGPGAPAFIHQVETGLISADATTALAVYPVQLILILGNLFIFSVLWHYRKQFKQPGALLFLGFFLLTAQRFGIEFFREAATNRGEFGLVWGGLKMAQWLCLILAIGGLLGFFYVLFRKAQRPAPVPTASIQQQAYVLGGIALGAFLLHDVLTLDETMIILVSCLPAMVVLGNHLLREYRAGQNVLAPVIMLSATAIGLFTNPIDSSHVKDPLSINNRRWIEVGAGGAFGNYKDVSRDCDGNVIRSDNVKYRSGGLDVNSNWQMDDLFLKAGIRTTFGAARTPNTSLDRHNYRYNSYGLYGRLSYRWIGLSLGVFDRQSTFQRQLNSDYKENKVLPSVGLRIGLAARYSVDLRVYDEPAMGFSNEPVFSMGVANWGFNDPSGDKNVRLGFAFVSNGESAFHLSGRFPMGSALTGDFAAYIGSANMVQLGLHYRFNVNQQY